MIFGTFNEVEMAHTLGKVHTHAKIKVRLPANRCLRDDLGKPNVNGKVVSTTVGRVIFNRMLPEGMPFYNVALRRGNCRA